MVANTYLEGSYGEIYLDFIEAHVDGAKIRPDIRPALCCTPSIAGMTPSVVSGPKVESRWYRLAGFLPGQ
jgi:hypothetical protein